MTSKMSVSCGPRMSKGDVSFKYVHAFRRYVRNGGVTRVGVTWGGN